MTDFTERKMDVLKALSHLLYQHECVVVPNFGGFLVKNGNARYNPELNRFYPPAGTVYFNADLKASDGLIANYLANEYKLSYHEANDAIEKWVSELRNIFHSKGNIVLKGIGSFTANKENKPEFTPDENANFLSTSFGLPAFTPHQVVYDETRNHVVRIKKERNTGHVLGETLKWAAVLLPFAFVATWSIFNLNTINSVVRSEAALFPWTFSTPGKSAHVHLNSHQNNVAPTTERSGANTFNYKSSAGVSAFAGYKALHYQLNGQDASEAKYLAENGYYVIGGAFKEYKNALRYTEQMKSLGYAAGMLGMNDKGLYVVYIQSCNSQSDALVQLSNIRRSVQPKAWLFRNK